MKQLVKTIVLFSFISQAQVSVEWSNYPGGVSVAVNQFHEVYSANWDYNPAGDITLTKRNSSGAILWSSTYDNTDNTRHEVATWLETDSQNNCIVSGTIRSGYSNPVNAASLLMKYNPQGVLLWRVVFESSFEGSSTRKILVDSSNNIYVLGLGMGPNGMVTRIKKFNSSGQTIWTYNDVNGIGAPINIKFTPDNALVVSGRGITGIINGYLKISLEGSLLWSKAGITSPTIGDIAGDSIGNSYIINGENVVSNAGSILEKLDGNGILIWSHTNAMAGSKVEVGSDNYPIISGFPNSGTGGAAFMKYNSNSAILWQNLNADGPEILLLHSQLKIDTANNAYLSAGNLFNMAVCKINSDGTNGWVGLVSGSSQASSFVLDSNNSIYVIGGTTAKLGQSPLSNDMINLSEFLVFPNPFISDLTILSKDVHGVKQLFIYDQTGKIIFQESFRELSKNINLSAISKGLYFLTINDDFGKIYHQKLVKK
jgi:Secretion system C-terminal sorting domain